jgi:hypothetical protein
MKAVISYTAPKFAALPTTVTEADVRDATLPVKIEAARRAIEQCESLPELLRYENQAQGLAAAVRVIKHVAPELVRSANEMVADAWRKGGELLRGYKGTANFRTFSKGKSIVEQGAGGATPSPRTLVAKEVGLTRSKVRCMVRIASAPRDAVYDAVQKTKAIDLVAAKLPPVDNRPQTRWRQKSAAYNSIMGQGTPSSGLVKAHTRLHGIPLEAFGQLAPDERKLVKAKIAEIIEMLDEMDRLCR